MTEGREQIVMEYRDVREPGHVSKADEDVTWSGSVVARLGLVSEATGCAVLTEHSGSFKASYIVEIFKE